VDAEADAEDSSEFRRFLDSVSPAELVRHLSKAQPEPEAPGEQPGEGSGESESDDDNAGASPV
jgi:hypothetical protein